MHLHTIFKAVLLNLETFYCAVNYKYAPRAENTKILFYTFLEMTPICHSSCVRHVCGAVTQKTKCITKKIACNKLYYFNQ